MTRADEGEDSYIVEFITVGKALKVTAMDPESLREVTIVGAPRVSRKQLAELAVRKLKYVIAKGKKN